MTRLDTIEQTLIRFFVHPLINDETINFTAHLKGAKKVLLLGLSGKTFKAHRSEIKAFTHLFPHASHTILISDDDRRRTKGKKVRNEKNTSIVSIALKQPHLWHLIRSESLKKLTDMPYDVLLDLNPNFCALGSYLCRTLHPPVRIGFMKPNGHRFYNVEYNGDPGALFVNRLEGLYRFIDSLLSSSDHQ